MILLLKDIQAIEYALSDLNLTDKFGDPMKGMMALPPVASFHGKEWDQTQDDFQNGDINSSEFAARQIGLIRQYGNYRYRLKLEKEITNIFSHQIGAQEVNQKVTKEPNR